MSRLTHQSTTSRQGFAAHGRAMLTVRVKGRCSHGRGQGWVYASATSSHNDAHGDSNIQQARADTLSQINDGKVQGGTLALVDGEYACKGEREGPRVICFPLVVLGGPAVAANVLDLAGVKQSTGTMCRLNIKRKLIHASRTFSTAHGATTDVHLLPCDQWTQK